MKETNSMLKRECSKCGKEVVRENSKKQRKVKNTFCNHKCQGEWQRGKNNPMYAGGNIEKQCVICDKTYQVKTKKRGDTSKVCSNACKGKYFILKSREVRNCLLCLEEFITRKALTKQYCSKECSDLAHSIRMTGEGNPRYVDGSAGERYPSEFSNKLREKIRERDNHTCQVCSLTEEEYEKALDVHHIDYNKENNEENNLISLCNKCHSTTNGSRRIWKRKLSHILNVKLKKQAFII